ncbi:hypothetical protein [Macrococcus armenti]|uniref:hypothetical protein n=1 Tax=Macrococcus armenti TaxID=2875764 RepID=UPI001CCD7A13|nr:hypothetical protein [Macrococcus armenti]UBH16443.1 hypothetical protein LAU44_05665 [Macrococcus armenti]UBH18799.1 hypothetical protein LAU39_05680 [Macrococcus armenti]UBH21071.1 hypothetical protein LAU40_05670 [Macrococcus armenti]
MNKKMMITTVFLCVLTLTACNKESEPEIKATTSKEKQSNVIKNHEVKPDKKLSDKAEKKIKAAKERGKSLIDTPSTERPTTEAHTTEIASTEVPVESLPQVENQQPEIIEQAPDQNVQDPNIQQSPLPTEGENTIEQPSLNQEMQDENVTETTIEAPAPTTDQVQ